MIFNELVQQQYSGLIPNASADEASFRARAFESYQQQGLPDRAMESWKYSTLQALVKAQWSAVGAAPQISRSARQLTESFSAEFDVVVLSNGQLLPYSARLPAGMTLRPRTLNSEIDLNYPDGFLSAAAAVNCGGYELRVSGSVQATRPLLLIHDQQGERSWNSTINFIYLERSARLSFAEIFVSDDHAYLRTDISRVKLQDGAEMVWLRAQQDSAGASHFAEVQAHLSARARLCLTQLNCGAAWSRTSLKADLYGEAAEVAIHGLSFGRDHQHVDQRVQVSHHSPYTNSAQLFKGVLKDSARGVLNGKIYIARGAQKVNSSQLNHNLLLGSGAEADTKPELEIYADDVKANHGASVGRLDEERMFYLLSRGIARTEAEQILARAFVGDVLMKIPSSPLRGLAEARVANLLPGFLAGLATAPSGAGSVQ